MTVCADCQASGPFPSLQEVEHLLASSSSSPSTLAPPHQSTYPSTSASASSGSSAPEAQRPNLIPVYVEIPADLLTPVAAYLKVAADSDHSFLLESIVAGEAVARYSFVGAGERPEMCITNDRPTQDLPDGRGL